ncbi:MAG TPA: hypothetical protein VGJ15_09820, partial [Pirellulales bacterium]
MSSFWRYTLLGLFGAAGLGVALCLAMSNPPAVDPGANGQAGAADTASHTAGSASDSQSASISDRANAAVVEQTAPPIASQATLGNSNSGNATGARSNLQVKIIAPQTMPSVLARTDRGPVVQLAQSTGANSAGNATGSLPALGAAADGNPPIPGLSDQAEVMQKLRQQLKDALDANQSGGSLKPGAGEALPIPSPSSGAAAHNDSSTGGAPKSKPRITRMPGEGDENLSIHIQDSDLRDVLELLSEQGGLNILPSPSVAGKVSASLNGVDIDTALAAILRSTGFISKRDGRFIYVGTPQDFKSMDQAADSVGTRVYHLNYIRADDVRNLVTPLLTPGVGSISVTAPANEGIGADGNRAGGNQFAGGDSVLVHDFVAVLNEIDQVIAEVDHKPAQVAIEAMILKVTLDDEDTFGVDFAFLRNNPNVRLFTGSPLGDLGSLKPNGGLSFAYLDSSTAAFVQALEKIGDTNIIASPKLMVIDKARAEILIGNQDGYVNSTVTETSTAQNVQFLETGAQLRLRPFISSDGMVRMEVHPELSTGNVEVTGGSTPLTLPHKDVTQVTTNIIVPDGCTVVIGGLMRQELDTTTQQIPLFGSLPGVGFLFRHKDEVQLKKEIIILITPHIICDSEACCDGDKAAAEFHRRQAVYADQMTPLGKRYLGRKFYRLAQAAWGKGDQQTALRFIDLSVHFDPESRAAINLRTDIWNGNLTGDHTLQKAGGPMMADDVPPEMMFSSPMGPPGAIAPPGEVNVPGEFGMPNEFGPAPNRLENVP